MAEAVTAACQKSRGRRILRDTVLRLIGAAGGHCERPSCPTGFLWHELSDGSAVRLGEVAHIVAASVEGPRADARADEAKLIAYDNLILLCPTCHTIVDRAPNEYSVETIRGWKATHEIRLAQFLGATRYETREQARIPLSRLLDQNRLVWEQYGPEAPDSWMQEVAETWLREVGDVILPNNARIAKLLEANAHLLRADEEQTVARFVAHSRSLEQRHILGIVNPVAPRFPASLNAIFSD